MDPPGNCSGFTTKLSAVMAMRAPSTARCAASPSGSKEPPSSIGAMRPSASLRLALPPAPCAISICVSRKRNLGAAVLMFPLSGHRNIGQCFAVLVVVVGSAGALGRNHQGSDGMLRSTFGSEQLALSGLQHALQDLAALRSFRIGHADARHGETALGIPVGVRIPDAQSRLRNEAHAAPLEVITQLKHFRYRPQCGAIPVPGH